MARPASFVLSSIAVFASVGSAQHPGTCDKACEYSLPDPDNNRTFTFNLKQLCNTTGDYEVSNATEGQTYYVNICGTARKSCAPVR